MRLKDYIGSFLSQKEISIKVTDGFYHRTNSIIDAAFLEYLLELSVPVVSDLLKDTKPILGSTSYYYEVFESLCGKVFDKSKLIQASQTEAYELYKSKRGEMLFEVAKRSCSDVWIVDDGKNVPIEDIDIDKIVGVGLDLIEDIAKSKIWKDEILVRSQQIIYEICVGVNPKNYELSYTMADGSVSSADDAGLTEDIDFMDEDIYLTDEFIALEKMQRKQRSPKHIHKYIDELDLKIFRELLVDEWGNKFVPKGWQGKFLINLRRFNFVAASRRCGKTMLAAYLILRQLMLPNQKVAVLIPELKNNAQPIWDYLVNMSTLLQFTDMKPDFTRSSWRVKIQKTNSTLTFYSGKNSVAIRGAASNLLVVDEAAYVHEKAYETASALVRTTKGLIYSITTVNIDVPKNWFYYKIVQAETDFMNPNGTYLGIRINIHKNPFIPEEEKKDIIENGKKNIDLFNAEWMAIFSDKSEFDVSSFWSMDDAPMSINILHRLSFNIHYSFLDPELKKRYIRFIISHDGAKRKDQPGITVTGFDNKGKGTIILAGYLKGFDYYDQVDALIFLYRMCGGESMCDVLIDYTGVGVAVEEICINKGLIVTPIMHLGGVIDKVDGHIRQVGKELMLGKLSAYLSLGNMTGFTWMKELSSEMEGYSPDLERQNGHHFDIISSLRQTAWYADKIGLFLDFERLNQGTSELRNDAYNEYTTAEAIGGYGSDTYNYNCF